LTNQSSQQRTSKEFDNPYTTETTQIDTMTRSTGEGLRSEGAAVYNIDLFQGKEETKAA